MSSMGSSRGSRTSLWLSLIVVAVTVTIGTVVGSLAGFIGGKMDEILMRVVDVFLAIPELIFALAIAAVLGPSFSNIILALAIVYWVKYARIIRGQIIHVKQNEYVDSARVIGDTKFRIYLKDVLPNSITPVMVQATMDMGAIDLVGATSSFIGLSEAGLAEWGVLVSEGQVGISTGRWWASTFPGLIDLPLGTCLQPGGRRSSRRPGPKDRIPVTSTAAAGHLC